MSKIGRKPIELGAVKVQIDGQMVHFKGKNAEGDHLVPDVIKPEFEGDCLVLKQALKTSDTNRLWGLHRALLSNKIVGAGEGFKKQVKIVGLGFKAIKKGPGLEFSLGYSHKIDFPLPKDVTVEIDKTGQGLAFWSNNKELLGLVCSKIVALRPPEPYKGTGVFREGDVIIRKAGKAKA
ncbi:MAG: 50S ribosomal protein L6 [candidate division TM6 bacterium GW2011_GWE2_42_60]|nr:MAG: 50S ribosomal protein L6 [candidate division TM6 bacterium GW2011_GWE2_42_60]HBY05562.1 50S ribosomal protein L6 [Candidatus Dependentiae bacterium]